MRQTRVPKRLHLIILLKWQRHILHEGYDILLTNDNTGAVKLRRDAKSPESKHPSSNTSLILFRGRAN